MRNERALALAEDTRAKNGARSRQQLLQCQTTVHMLQQQLAELNAQRPGADPLPNPQDDDGGEEERKKKSR